MNSLDFYDESAATAATVITLKLLPFLIVIFRHSNWRWFGFYGVAARELSKP